MGDNKQLFETTGTLTSAEIPVDIRALAGALAIRHGDVSIAMESRGTHLYLACPDCLEKDGDKELRGRHLAVNADMYLGTGKWASLKGTYDFERSSMCMKTEKPFSVDDLLSMPPLNQRGIKVSQPGKVTSTVNPDRLVDDGRGNMIPEGPGVCLPITALPKGHHAVAYLEGRGYDRKSLWAMFRCSYCVRELEEDREKSRFYRRMAGGFKDTPQGRIIFYADMYGVQRAWQARIIDKIVDDLEHYYWHPYENKWALYRWRERKTDEWTVAYDFQDDFLEFKPSKYKTAAGSSRNSTLMCLDAARRWNEEQGRGFDKSIVFLGEGPLELGTDALEKTFFNFASILHTCGASLEEPKY